ncbi:MAG: hypothetical protein LBS95_00070, partial [Mycoplasmataceae bacterium]|nr:hypothetical protein [Mycoplasmataceae bacterium]
MNTFLTRQLEVIIKQIAKKLGIQYHSYASGWIIGLTKNKITKYIYGYNFLLNSAVASKLCDDKAAISEILISNNIPSFQHKYFMKNYYAKKDVVDLFNKFKNDVVVKPNIGSSGNDVFHCQNSEVLFEKIDLILQ